MKINKKPSIDFNTNPNNIQNNQRKDNLKILNQRIKNSKNFFSRKFFSQKKNFSLRKKFFLSENFFFSE